MTTTTKYPLQIVVGAIDRATATLARIKERVGKLNEPFRKLNGLMRMAGVHRGLSAIWSAMQKVALGATGAILGVTALVARVTNLGDQTSRLSERMGVSAQALQRWRYAAEASGVPAATLDNAMVKLSRRMAEARAGYGEGRQALHALGVELVDAQGRARGLEQVLPELFDKLDGIQDPTAKLAFAVKLFEEEGTALIQTAKGGSKALAEMGKRAEELGLVISDEQLEQSRKFQRRMLDVRSVLTGVGNRIAFAVLPVVERMSGAFASWVERNQPQIQKFADWIARRLPEAVNAAKDAVGDARGWLSRQFDKMPEIMRDLKAPLWAIGVTVRGAFWLAQKSIEGVVLWLQHLKTLVTGDGLLQQILGKGANWVIEGNAKAGEILRMKEMADRIRQMGAGMPGPRDGSPDRATGTGTIEAQQRTRNILVPPPPPIRRTSMAAPASAGEIRVSFENLPKGARVSRDEGAKRSTSLRLGWAMPEVGLA